MTRIMDNPAHYITMHFDHDEKELCNLFVEYYKTGFAVWVRGLERGYWVSEPYNICPALTFFSHLVDDIVPTWEDFIHWLTYKEDEVA